MKFGQRVRRRMAQSNRRYSPGISVAPKTVSEAKERAKARVLRTKRVLSPEDVLQRLRGRTSEG